MNEEFNVALFFPNGDYVYEAKGLDAERAVLRAKECTLRPAAHAGLISRIIVTDRDDYTVFEWQANEGVTYPRYDSTKGKFVADPSGDE